MFNEYDIVCAIILGTCDAHEFIHSERFTLIQRAEPVFGFHASFFSRSNNTYYATLPYSVGLYSYEIYSIRRLDSHRCMILFNRRHSSSANYRDVIYTVPGSDHSVSLIDCYL